MRFDKRKVMTPERSCGISVNITHVISFESETLFAANTFFSMFQNIKSNIYSHKHVADKMRTVGYQGYKPLKEFVGAECNENSHEFRKCQNREKHFMID